MRIFTPLITEKEADVLIKSPIITLDMRYKLDSVTFPTTLANYIGDLKDNELNKTYRLEAENLYHLINAVSIVLRRDKSSDVFYSMKMVNKIIQHSETLEQDKETRKKMLFMALTRYMLSLLTSKSETDVEVKFYGEVPKKFFSFRQKKANTWFNEYVDYVLFYASNLLLKGETDEITYYYVAANTIWYLNKSQPFKYCSKINDEDSNKTIGRLFIEFVSSMDGNKDYLNTNTDTALKF